MNKPWKELVGKTIHEVKKTSNGDLSLKFTDGTKRRVDIEYVLYHGSYRPALFLKEVVKK